MLVSIVLTPNLREDRALHLSLTHTLSLSLSLSLCLFSPPVMRILVPVLFVALLGLVAAFDREAEWEDWKKVSVSYPSVWRASSSLSSTLWAWVGTVRLCMERCALKTSRYCLKILLKIMTRISINTCHVWRWLT